MLPVACCTVKFVTPTANCVPFQIKLASPSTDPAVPEYIICVGVMSLIVALTRVDSPLTSSVPVISVFAVTSKAKAPVVVSMLTIVVVPSSILNAVVILLGSVIPFSPLAPSYITCSVR